MTLSGMRFSVIGMGRSGISAAKLILNLGGDCILSDKRDDPELRQSVKDIPVEKVFGKELIRENDIVVLSPGIPPSSPVFREAERRGCEIISEVELFYRVFSGRIIAITGTDGKSTTTTMTAHLLRCCGLNAREGGNLGNPLCDLLYDISDDTIVVAEVSCFQLITCKRFRPQVAVITNLAEDHLEYHGSFNAYIRAKARVLANQAHGDVFVRNMDDPILRRFLTPDDRFTKENGQEILECSQNIPVFSGVFMKDGVFFIADKGKNISLCPRDTLCLPGRHNVENALLSICACLPFSKNMDGIIKGLRSFKGLPHRIEFVREKDGVRFFNDSKATNPHSTIFALRSFDEPVILIAGGHEKGLSLIELGVECERRCKGVVLTGESAQRMFQELPPTIKKEIVNSLEEAVTLAFYLAKPKGIVLFSPGCSSYDRFKNFEERGEVFKRIVLTL